MAGMTHAEVTLPGRREKNEDACTVRVIADGVHFLAVADGLGGALYGEVASALAIQAAVGYLEAQARRKGGLGGDPAVLLRGLYAHVQSVVRAEKERRPNLRSMATTLACVVIVQDRYAIGNVGDSRVYLLHGPELSLITEDHTYLQAALKEEGTGRRPAKGLGNVLTRCIDGGSDPPDVFPRGGVWGELGAGCGFLLCTDGLILDKRENASSGLRDTILGTRTLQDAAEQLVSGAFHAGSTDNITVVLAECGTLSRRTTRLRRFPFPPEEAGIRRAGNPPRRRRVGVVHGGLLAMLIVAAVLVPGECTEPGPERPGEIVLLADAPCTVLVWGPEADSVVCTGAGVFDVPAGMYSVSAVSREGERQWGPREVRVGNAGRVVVEVRFSVPSRSEVRADDSLAPGIEQVVPAESSADTAVRPDTPREPEEPTPDSSLSRIMPIERRKMKRPPG
ncbi:MAG: protein phosphatase 2C domain-containing protein [Bacteroidota bacterium]